MLVVLALLSAGCASGDASREAARPSVLSDAARIGYARAMLQSQLEGETVANKRLDRKKQADLEVDGALLADDAAFRQFQARGLVAVPNGDLTTATDPVVRVRPEADGSDVLAAITFPEVLGRRDAHAAMRQLMVLRKVGAAWKLSLYTRLLNPDAPLPLSGDGTAAHWAGPGPSEVLARAARYLDGYGSGVAPPRGQIADAPADRAVRASLGEALGPPVPGLVVESSVEAPSEAALPVHAFVFADGSALVLGSLRSAVSVRATAADQAFEASLDTTGGLVAPGRYRRLDLTHLYQVALLVPAGDPARATFVGFSDQIVDAKGTP